MNYIAFVIKKAGNARLVQETIGFKSDEKLKTYIRRNCIKNTKTTTSDLDRANEIYTPSENMLKGNDTRKKARNNQRTLRIPVPPKILSGYIDLELFFNIIYVCNLPFLITRSGNIDLCSIQSLNSISLKMIAKGIKNGIDKHCARGFKITDFHPDLEFDKEGFHDFLEPGTLHICARDDHIETIERDSWKIQERSRHTAQSIPYTIYTKLMVMSLLERIMYGLNSFPSNTRI